MTTVIKDNGFNCLKCLKALFELLFLISVSPTEGIVIIYSLEKGKLWIIEMHD